jgi:hypothetical protein
MDMANFRWGASSVLENGAIIDYSALERKNVALQLIFTVCSCHKLDLPAIRKRFEKINTDRDSVVSLP